MQTCSLLGLNSFMRGSIRRLLAACNTVQKVRSTAKIDVHGMVDGGLF